MEYVSELNDEHAVILAGGMWPVWPSDSKDEEPVSLTL